MLQITPTLHIQESELDERFVRASGPGGQHVNKVATAVELRFDVTRSRAIDPEMRERLGALAGSRLTSEGVLVIDARRHRTQAENRRDARNRLVTLLKRAAARPKRRRRTRPTRESIQRRVASKRRRAETKRRRGRVVGEE